MRLAHRVGSSGLALATLFLAVASAQAEDLSGTVVRTLTLSENSRLVGDMTCQVSGAPCIAFGAPNISLNLNGFAITGQIDATVGCKGTNVAAESGVTTNGQANVGVRGPGLIQRFQGDGILFAGTIKGWVQGVTTTTNCMSGIRISPTSSGVSIESNVSVRNGTPAAPCGGIWIQGSNNSLRWNETSGNGYATGTAVDFGIGVLSGDGNIVEANTAIGNTNGIVVFTAATNNQVRQNVAVGNPPIQQSNSVSGATGVDIWDQSPPSNHNSFLGNMCVTAINVACPTVATQAIPRKPGS